MAIATQDIPSFCVVALLVASAATSHAQDPLDVPNNAPRRETSRVVRFDELGDPLPPQARFQVGTERFVSRQPVFDMALSPDGKTLLTRDVDSITCWDTGDGKIRWSAQLEFHESVSYGLRAFAFASNSDSFYSQSEPEKLLKWNALSGKSTSIAAKNSLPLLAANRPVNSFPGATLAIDVAQDGSKIAAAGSHGVIVYDAAGNSLFEIPNKPDSAIAPEDWHRDTLLKNGHYSLAVFSPDSKEVAVLTSDTPQRVRFVDTQNGELRYEVELESRLIRMAFSPDGSTFVTTERNGSVSQFSTTAGNRTWRYRPESFEQVLDTRDDILTSAVAYSPDNKLVAVAVLSSFGEETIQMLDATSGQPKSEFLGHTQKPWALAFTADSKTLYSAGLDRVIRRWNVPQATEIPLEKGFHGSGIVASAPSGNRIAYSDSTGNIHVADTKGARLVDRNERIFKAPNSGVTALALSRTGDLLACGCSVANEWTVTVWNTSTSEALHDWQWKDKDGRAPRIGTLEFALDGKRLAAAANARGVAYLLDVVEGKLIAEVKHPTPLQDPKICGMSFDHTSKQLVTAGANEKLCFWDAETGKLLSTHEMIGGDLQNLRCSPVDDTIVTAHFPNVLRIWNSKDMTLRKRAPLSGEANFESLAFSSDGNWLATASSGIVNVINARTAERLWQAGSHRGRALTVGFSEQDKVLVSGGSDGMVYCWELMPQDVAGAPNFDQIWTALCNGNDDEIKSLKWELVQIGDAAVDEVERRLKTITRVVNLRAISKGVDRETAESRIRLAMQLCEKNPAVEIDVRLKHAIDFLAMLRNPKSMALLKQLATSHPSKDVRKEAMFALETNP